MTTEGMVHALEEINRLLKLDGSLIDIHPCVDTSRIEVYQKGRLLFYQSKKDCSNEAYRQADKALVQAVQNGLYVLEEDKQFDYVIYGSSVAELEDYFAEINAYVSDPEDEEMIAQRAEIFTRAEQIKNGAGEDAEIATHEKVHIARLKPVK